MSREVMRAMHFVHLRFFRMALEFKASRSSCLFRSPDRFFCDPGIRLHWSFGNLQLPSGGADEGTYGIVGWTTDFVSVLSFSSTERVDMPHLNRPLPPIGILRV